MMEILQANSGEVCFLANEHHEKKGLTTMSHTLAQRSVARSVGAAALAMFMMAGTAAGECPADQVYGAPQSASTGSLPLGAAAGDLNNDGNVDLVTANFFGGNGTMLLGNGDGTFQAGVELPMLEPGSIETVGVVAAAVGDVNGDGWNDIVFGVQSPDLGNPGAAVFLNDGTGAFPDLPEFYGFGFASQVRDMVLADVDGDGNLDAIYADRDDNSISVLYGNGDGTFPILPDFVVVTGGPTGVLVEDFDNNGTLDFASSLVFSNEVAVLSGDGAGNFTEVARFGADGPEGIAAGDINGDGNLDLLTPFLNGDQVQYFIGNGDGTFGAKQVINTGASSLPITCGLGDANGDGLADVHAGIFLNAEVQVHLSNGDGTFQAPNAFGIGDRPRDFVFADFNGDGRDDIAAANGVTTGTATVALANVCGCTADWNGDTNVNTADFVDFLNDYNAVRTGGTPTFGDPDLAEPFGVLNTSDFVAFLNIYNAGC